MNGTNIPKLPNPAASFVAPTWAVWVNGLWFMSLVIGLTCAVLATLLQQWARRYLRVAYPRYSPHKRARIRAFYAKGVEKWYFQKMVEVLPLLLHTSLFLFLAGLAVFLFNVNLSIFKAVMVWIGLCVILYAYLTILPIFHKNSPYSVPLSGLVSFCLTGIRSTFFRLVERFPGLFHIFPSRLQPRNRDPTTVQLLDFFSRSMRTTAEQFAFRMGPEIDFDSLMWTFESLDEDKEFEQFFDGIPGLCDSKMVPNALNTFIRKEEKMFSSALIGLIDRTLSSNLVSEPIKLRRIKICTKVVCATSLLGPWWILRRVLLGNWKKFLECIEFGLFVQHWRSIAHPVTRFYAQCVAAITISSVTVQECDDRWFQLASGALGTSKNSFQNYLKHRDNILLANAISILRQTIQTYSGAVERHRSDILGVSSKTLESLRRLDLGHTFPDLQHEFCAVWNQLVDLAQNDDRTYIVCVATAALKNIHKLFIGLHEGTNTSPTAFSSATDDSDPVLDDPSSYCKCYIAGHRPSQSVPELRIEEPSPEVASGVPLTPVVSPGTIPASHSQAILLPTSFLTLSRPPPSFLHPTYLTASHVRPQAAFGHTTPPSIAPTPVEQLDSTLPVRQPAFTVPFISGGPNEGVSSTPSLGSAGQAR